MIATCHKLSDQFIFVPRPNLTVLGYAGSCFKVDTGEANGLGMVIDSISPTQTVITLEPHDNHAGEVSWVNHPNNIITHAWWQVRHSLTPTLKAGCPTDYHVNGELALLGLPEGELYVHDVGGADARGINEYLAQHPPYTEPDLQIKLVDACIYAALEVGLATVPAGDTMLAWVNTFRSALIFAHLFPNLTKYAVSAKEAAAHPILGEDATHNIWRQMFESMEITVAEHPEEMYEMRDAESSAMPDALKDLLRDINLDPDQPLVD